MSDDEHQWIERTCGSCGRTWLTEPHDPFLTCVNCRKPVCNYPMGTGAADNPILVDVRVPCEGPSRMGAKRRRRNTAPADDIIEELDGLT